MEIPEELQYTKDHEWIKIDRNIATIGITDFAQSELGDIVYVDIETVDETIEGGEVFGSIEAVKTVSDLFMPITGTVTEVNEIVEDAPEKVNGDPYGDGWLVRIKLADDVDTDDLMTASAYRELVGY